MSRCRACFEETRSDTDRNPDYSNRDTELDWQSFSRGFRAGRWDAFAWSVTVIFLIGFALVIANDHYGWIK